MVFLFSLDHEGFSVGEGELQVLAAVVSPLGHPGLQHSQAQVW